MNEKSNFWFKAETTNKSCCLNFPILASPLKTLTKMYVSKFSAFNYRSLKRVFVRFENGKMS